MVKIDHKFTIIILFINIVYNLESQSLPELTFYKHYNGTMDTTMQLVLDLSAIDGKVAGNYYYYFKMPGNENVFHFGKTVPIEGVISGTKIKMQEFGNSDSEFLGNISENEITGTWKRREYEDPIHFKLREDYSIGSLSLTCYTLTRRQKIIHEEVDESLLPSAKINIIILYPDQTLNTTLKDTLDRVITKFMYNKAESLNSPELLMENITFDFFQSYIRATNGIGDITRTASFNWEKRLSMDVRYNANSIVSLSFEKYGYTGGAHGIKIKEFFVYYLNWNKQLQLNDIFIAGYNSALNKLLDSKLRKINGIKADESLRDAGFFIDRLECTENFYVNNDGMGFYYNVYQLASYAMGATELFLPYNDIKHLLKNNHPFQWVLP
ncbi:MAG: DUF3298 domain-containing protein [Bacteroidales bacterium]